MDDLLQEFLTETAESIETLDTELVMLEQNPNDPELLSNIFRLVHTIKGTCGFLGLPRLESVAHAAENVLGKIRDGALEVTPDAVSLILESLDQIKALLAALEENEAEPEGDDADLIARLNAFANSGAVAPAEASDGGGEDAETAEAGEETATTPESAEAESESEESGEGEVSLEELEAAFQAAPGPEDMAGEKAGEAEHTAEVPAEAGQAKAEEPAKAESRAVATTGASVPAKPAEKEQKKGAPAKEGGGKEPSVAAQTIRVNVDLLENLMTMVSELVLTRNQLLQILRTERESEFAAPLQRLSHVTTELQEGVMKTRMQPIGNAWAKLPRIVRDLSVELGKKIDLQMIGADTELDRQVLELIKDPLTHMVRNSADHGIEMPEERIAAGKPEIGTITLNAFHEGGHIIIEISDDGRGLDIEKIKQKVIANGLAEESELETMSEQQIQQFIFRPGFSTASQVTSVSGRGVGMDVVRTNIEKIGGTVELQSKYGKGSTFIIKIPLTLAIVSALIIECAGERFAIPQISVLELVRASKNSEHTIEQINGTPVLRLRNRLLPLVPLRSLMRLDDQGNGVDLDETFVVVTQVGNYTFGIVVDRVFDTEEIVVKPVAPVLRNIPVFSGNTILGDGSVIMILDPNGIASQTGEISVTDHSHGLTGAVADEDEEERVALLLFRAGGETPKAVPLALVARLEEIELDKVEYSEGQPVVQYRGRLMPLVPVDEGFELQRTGRQPVLVFSDRNRAMGLIVDEIVDIVEDRLKVELSGTRPGILGSAIIAGRATEIIDTEYFLTRAFPDWFGDAKALPAAANGSSRNGRRILLIDDSPFFRNLIAPMLSVAGYSVTAVDGADKALQMCEEGRDFDVIISDIEMPGMDGFELASTLRNGSRWAQKPIVALSAHATPEDFERGRAAGFTDYVAKFDREGLLQTLAETCSAA